MKSLFRLGTKLIFPVTGTALSPVTACYIQMDFFISSLKVNHDYALQLLLFYAAELQESEKNMRNLAHMNVKGRVAQALLKLEQNFGVSEDDFLVIELSRQDLASLAGTTYETTFRILNELVDAQAIALVGKQIKVVDREALTALTREG